MKNFPFDYNKEELKIEIQSLFKEYTSTNRILSNEEKKFIIEKIKIAQIQLNFIENFENKQLLSKQKDLLDKLIKNNNSTSKVTIFFSIVMLFVTIYASYLNFTNDNKNKKINDKVINILQSIDKTNKKNNNDIKSIFNLKIQKSQDSIQINKNYGIH